MSEPFFGKYGDEITFDDKIDLIVKFTQIDCSVPHREEGRKTYHRERESIKIFMEQLACMNKLKYPLTLKKDESPDFIIRREPGFTIGLEHIEATTDQIQQEQAAFSRSNQDPFINENTGPEFGYRVDKAAKGIIDSIKKKTFKLNKPNYTLYDRNELLIFTELISVGDEGITLEKFYSKYEDLSLHKDYNRLFDSISVIFRHSLQHNVIDYY